MTEPATSAPSAPETSAVVPRAPAESESRRETRAQLHPVAQVFDQLGDIAGMCLVGAMCLKGRISGESAAVIILLILGVQTGLRGGLARMGGPRAGAAALLLLGIVHVAHLGAHSQPGFLRLPRFVEHAVVALRLAWAWATSEPRTPKRRRRGFARLDAFTLCLGVGAVCFAVAALAGCPLPPPSGCTPGDTRCSREGIPQRCSSTQRWWQEPTAQSCSAFGAACCRATSPYGGTVHACVPQPACLPEQPATGATSTPPALAVTQ